MVEADGVVVVGAGEDEAAQEDHLATTELTSPQFPGEMKSSNNTTTSLIWYRKRRNNNYGKLCAEICPTAFDSQDQECKDRLI